MIIQYHHQYFCLVADHQLMILLVNHFLISFLIISYCLFHLDFCTSNDERIKSYFIYQDWNDELQDANENRWNVDQNKFDIANIVQEYEIQRKRKLFFKRYLFISLY